MMTELDRHLTETTQSERTVRLDSDSSENDCSFQFHFGRH
jgi:hypothetical protein